MKKNCRWSLGLLLSALILLVGCQDPKPQAESLTLSKTRVSIAVGEEIMLTRAGEGGAVEVTLPAGEDFTLSVDNGQIAQVDGKTIKGLAAGKASVTVTAGTQHATLIVEVQASNNKPEQKLTLSPTSINVPVGRAVVFGTQQGNGVDVVVTTEPAADFAISTSESDKVQISGHKVTGLAVGSYTLEVSAGSAKATFDLTVEECADKDLTGTFLKNSGKKTIFVPDKLDKVWDLQEKLKNLMESNTNYLFDHLDEEHKAIWFIDKNAKTGRFAMAYSHIAYVIKPGGGEMPYLEGIYLDQLNGMFELIWVGLLEDVGFQIDPNSPPELAVDQDGSHYFEDVHPSLPYMVRIFYKTRTDDSGSKVEDIYVRMTPIISM
ncbi:Ig-like domain-containing protein [uncultured Porphyromonas sp.]|uniref:Ig-like domain-containing protein n=1 Tax=uncultured Porphyromonas sp. TaxID=159274 RepID=UPI002622331B|nr:Ig-like domain-containing protein [uncultured Porphyromonas sp.]